jgi:hypothetical protein
MPNVNDLKPDYKAAAKFLGGLPLESINVTALAPDQDKPIKSHSFKQDAAGIAGCQKFLEKYGSEGRNLYFNCNDLSVRLSKSKRTDGSLAFKANEAEVARVNMLFIDLDPPKGTPQVDLQKVRAELLARAKAYQPAPSIIINSGNGFGLFWALEKPIKVTPANLLKLKGYNKKLIDDLQGDPACVNLDHVMRIPFTINMPGKNKREAGRVPALASVVYDGAGLDDYKINQFSSATVEAAAGAAVTSGNEYEQIGSPEIPDKVDLSKLPPELQARIIKGARANADRSAAAYRVACDLRRAGWSDGAIIRVLTNPDYGISDHVLDQKQRKPKDQASRVINQMNRDHVESVAQEFDDSDRARALRVFVQCLMTTAANGYEPGEVAAAKDRMEALQAKYNFTEDEVQRAHAIRRILLMLKITVENKAQPGDAANAEQLIYELSQKYKITPEEIAAAQAGDTGDTGGATSGADTADIHQPIKPNATWESLLKDYVYIKQQERFIERADGTIYTVKAFENAFKSVRFWINPAGSSNKIPTSVTQKIFDLGPNGMEMFKSACFAPGQPPRYQDNFNQWRPSPFKPKEGDTTLWDAHLEYVLPDAADRAHVLDWMAWVYQHPTEHPEYAVAMIGIVTGTGKTFLPTVLSRLLSDTPVSRLRQAMIEAAHQTWMLRTKVPIIEIFEANKEITKWLHDAITSPTINVDMKNAQDYDIPNVLAIWIESNQPNAITGMNNTDRRFLIVSVDRDGAHLQPKPDSYYWKLYGRKGGPRDGLIDNPDLMGAIAYQLKTRDLSNYSGNRAPLTAAKKKMQADTDSPLKQWMVEHAGTAEEADILSQRLLQIEDVIAVLPTHITRNYKGGDRPVGDGLVMSLARPGGNITGLSLQQNDIAGKRLELLREVVPHLRRLGIMFDAGYPADLLEVGEVEAMARTLGIEITRLEIRRADDIAPAFEALKSGADALYVCTDALTVTNRLRISTLALAGRLPMISGAREDLEVGGLMSYGPNLPDLFRRAADYVDKILRGTKPGDLPVEQPTKFDLVVNLTTAKALGLAIPDKLLAIADQVIE